MSLNLNDVQACPWKSFQIIQIVCEKINLGQKSEFLPPLKQTDALWQVFFAENEQIPKNSVP